MRKITFSRKEKKTFFLSEINLRHETSSIINSPQNVNELIQSYTIKFQAERKLFSWDQYESRDFLFFFLGLVLIYSLFVEKKKQKKSAHIFQSIRFQHLHYCQLVGLSNCNTYLLSLLSLTNIDSTPYLHSNDT